MDEIRRFVETKSYLHFDEANNGKYVFRTRENGDVGNESYSDIDYTHALQIANELSDKYRNSIISVRCHIETCDEWVLLNVYTKMMD